MANTGENKRNIEITFMEVLQTNLKSWEIHNFLKIKTYSKCFQKTIGYLHKLSFKKKKNSKVFQEVSSSQQPHNDKAPGSHREFNYTIKE